MKNLTTAEYLDSISTQDTTWKAKAEWRKANKEMLAYSAQIAIKILSKLRQNRISGQYPNTISDLTEMTGISKQEIERVVSGNAYIATELIYSIQSALNIQLVESSQNKSFQIVTEVEVTYITTYDGGYVTNTKQETDLSKPNHKQAGNTSYAMAA